jgi:2-oxoglutarate dehydrogenase E2 component (dihydrolipoamide succinyltransferase)
MNYQVKVPAVGESITSGSIAAWHKKNNDHVKVGDLLFTLETDKVSTEVTATESGALKTLVEEGAEVKIGAIVAEIIPVTIAPSPVEEVVSPENLSSLSSGTAKKSVASVQAPLEQLKSKEEDEVKSEKSISSTSTGGLNHDEATASSFLLDEKKVTRKKLTPLRRKIAAQLVAAQQTAAILTTFNECDMSSVMTLRRDIQEKFQAKHGVKLGFMSFFIKAAVEALKAIPEVNVELEGEELLQHHYYDIGVAVGTEKGLVVPVVRDAEKQSLAELEQQLLGYATKAREGKITLADLQGGVFTISNGGVYGSLLSTPILNPPQSAILGMHKIQERPVVVNGKIEIRPMMYLALSYDHRVIDGQQAVTFLIKIKETIENPMRLLII